MEACISCLQTPASVALVALSGALIEVACYLNPRASIPPAKNHRTLVDDLTGSEDQTSFCKPYFSPYPWVSSPIVDDSATALAQTLI
jgi:hypothetical protein